jgi:peptidoglycan/LPS O-acetylase OafA/YrhL
VSLMIWLEEQGATGWIGDLEFPTLLALSAAFATACAAASYYLVEKPLLRFKDPRPPRAVSREPEAAPTTG